MFPRTKTTNLPLLMCFQRIHTPECIPNTSNNSRARWVPPWWETTQWWPQSNTRTNHSSPPWKGLNRKEMPWDIRKEIWCKDRCLISQWLKIPTWRDQSTPITWIPPESMMPQLWSNPTRMWRLKFRWCLPKIRDQWRKGFSNPTQCKTKVTNNCTISNSWIDVMAVSKGD